MALERTTLQAKVASERRPASAATTLRKAVSATPSPARALQQRLGNQAMQTLLARRVATDAAATLPVSAKAATAAERPSGSMVAGELKAEVVRAKEAPASPGSLVSRPGSKAPPQRPASAQAAPPTAGKPSAKPAEKAKGKEIAAQRGKEGGPEAGVPDARTAIAPAISAVHHRAAAARKHTAPGVAVASAQAAALSPDVERKRAAATQTVATLDAAKAEEVRRNEFKAKLKRAIEEATPKPKTEAEAERVQKAGAAQASGALRGQLATERDAAAGPLKAANATEVAASAQPAPPVAALQTEPVGPPPAPVSAAPIVPAPLPPERLDYSADRGPTEQVMAENNVSQEQMQDANDPAFAPALAARSSAEQHEASAAAQYRQGESKIQGQAQSVATQAMAKDLIGLHGVREQQLGKVTAQQLGTKGKDAQERQRITDTVNGIKDRTRADVDALLKSLEEEAGKIFEAGLQRAERAYEDAFEEAKGGVGTWLTTWGSDWEEHIEQALATARARYLREVDSAIDEVATFVESKLKAAKQRVADGRQEVEKFVTGLDASVKQFGEEALQAVSADFDTMSSDIDQRRDALISKLTEQYKASYERMSAMENKLREENKSLWQRVYDATVGLIKKIIEFKNMLLGILAKAASVIGDIIAHPIRFLGNLVTGVMQGLRNFMSKIGTYLLKGLMDWLFGALAGAGLQLPDKFDLQGIISIVLQILGLTYANFRARAVAIVGEPVVAAIEKTAEVFKVIVTEGVPGLWRFIKEQLANLKSMVLDAIFDFIKEKVIMAGITWIIGLLNPASAFFKACKAIYEIVMFFINRGRQILALVNAVIDSMAAIAQGAVGVAAGFVENALAKAIPVAIGFLAGLLGLGDPSKPVREFIEKARAPVNKAIDWVINLAVKGVKAVGKLVGKLVGKKDAPDDRTPAEKTRDLQDAKREADEILAEEHPSEKVVLAKLRPIKDKYRLTNIQVVGATATADSSRYRVKLVINPELETDPVTSRRRLDKIQVVPPFKLKPSLSEPNFLEQLGEQERTMNEMTVSTWLANRARFEQFKRSDEGDTIAREIWQRETAALEAKVVANRTAAYIAAKKSPSEARRMAGEFFNRLIERKGRRGPAAFLHPFLVDPVDNVQIKNDLFGKAALHKLDQIAGGDPKELAPYLGSEREDYSIGKQWSAKRLQSIHEGIAAQEVTYKLTKEELANIQMHVALLPPVKTGD